MRYVVIFLALVGACRPDPGEHRYSSYDPITCNAGTEDPVCEPGPDPYEAGDIRLSVGVFYEGESSDSIPVDNTVNFFWLYEDTVAVEADSSDVVEGCQSDSLVRAGGLAWWGLGVHWPDTPRDLSPWSTMHISLKSSDSSFANVSLVMQSEGTSDEVSATLSAADYGYANDGQWHHLTVPLADFVGAGLDDTAVVSPFGLSGQGGTEGHSLNIDNLYFTAE
jgi:hypothetical protein